MKLKTKLGILLISISSVMLYVGCSSSDSSTSALEDLVANTLADLPNCTEKREGKTAVILEDNSTYLCTEGKWEKWRSLTDTLSTADDLLACVSKREGNTAFITKENALYKCMDGSWKKIVTGTFTDTRDGQIYKTVKIGDQVWMAENLNYKIDGSFCYESFTPNSEKYGCLYSKLSALHACPEGWHLPTVEEFETLISNVGGKVIAGKMLKSQTGWEKYEGEYGNGIDAFGFNALPAGFSNSYGVLGAQHEEAYFLGATDDWSEGTATLNLRYYFGEASLMSKKEDGNTYYSVRCLWGSNNESAEKEPVEQCEEKKLSKACLHGEWTVSTLDGAMLSYAGAGVLKFSDSRFRYTPAVADLAYTYCPGTELEGTYEIISPTQIKLTVGGIRLYDCFLGKEIIVNAAILENELRLTGTNQSPFVPNDEGLKTEVYNRTISIWSEDSSSNAEESTSSSSVDAACTEVVATEVTLSNILETDQYAINLVTGLAENPHLTLEIVDNMAYFQAAPGVEIWEEETQDFGLLPEAPVCLESFKIAFGSQTNRLELMGNMWLYIKTPEGYFPMMLGKVKYQDEKTGSIIITYYK